MSSNDDVIPGNLLQLKKNTELKKIRDLGFIAKGRRQGRARQKD
jgi:hypothetical protein